MPLPHLTRDFPGIGGSIKNRPEDFFVQELPLYEPSGEGEHVYCEIQKVGLTTFQLIDQLARALRVPAREIGYAGMKDAQAVTRQILSIWGTTPEAIMALQMPDVTVQWAMRHGNKLRLGHLAGNRFAIKVRDVEPTHVLKLRPVIETLERRGLPNYFGEQRFGRRNDNDRLGAAVVRGDDAALLKLLLGCPDETVDDPATVKARAAFDAGGLQTSMLAWPGRARMELTVLNRLIKTGNPADAVRSIEERVRRLWVSALQSRLFNDVVARRVTNDTFDKLIEGDLAWKHDSGAAFQVESVETEQPRCANFEISPSGPLVGYRMTLPQGEALRMEEAVFAAEGLKPEDFRRAGDLKVKGARRPLRVKPEDVALEAGGDAHGPYITAAFTLSPGSFATVLMVELMKVGQADEA